MRFVRLLENVQRAEQRVERRAVHTQVQWTTLKAAWRAGWTPGRIVIAGLVSGFVVGRAEPLGALTGARWMQMFAAPTTLMASRQRAGAPEQAEQPADTAQDAQAQAEGDYYAGEEPAVEQAFDEDEVVVTAPRPAEAATELSER